MNMRTNIRIILLVIGSLLGEGCKENREKIEKDVLSHAIAQLDTCAQYEWIVILPGAGCHGCIQEGEFFMKENIANPRILFVLTSISSLKILQQKTGIRIDEHANIYIDRDNYFKIPTEHAIYPCIIQVKEGEILQHAFQSPKSTAFRTIKNIFNNKYAWYNLTDKKVLFIYPSSLLVSSLCPTSRREIYGNFRTPSLRVALHPNQQGDL